MWTKENIPDQTGKTILITGANTGLGFETALALYGAGAHVVLACRNLKNAEDALIKLYEPNGKGTLETGVLDLSNLSSVKQFADTFLQKHKQLDVLINNAGVAMPPASKTAQGYELQFGVNFLGHFALTGRLYPLLKETSNSRIITFSSNGYQGSVIDFDNLKSETGYDAIREYRQSKLANLIFSVELQRRIVAKGVKVLSIAAQPGANKTELTRYLSEAAIAAGVERLGEFMEPWQGALSSLYAAVSNEASGGNMYEPDEGGYRGYPTLATIQENALDETVAKKLWGLAEQVTGVYYPL
ncbi:oxidoreductase [uncultured Mucilaginibacter sp.]|uniref:oxidoreductase n=1 Tax=uncultured Mucilaginibacter sp. TaxID=797541 RepID=UPI002629C171|nr:oxidoreductase [uncultured Mucilaginibacter sp.]